jgi:hypothetical protein
MELSTQIGVVCVLQGASGSRPGRVIALTVCVPFRFEGPRGRGGTALAGANGREVGHARDREEYRERKRAIEETSPFE